MKFSYFLTLLFFIQISVNVSGVPQRPTQRPGPIIVSNREYYVKCYLVITNLYYSACLCNACPCCACGYCCPGGDKDTFLSALKAQK